MFLRIKPPQPPKIPEPPATDFTQLAPAVSGELRELAALGPAAVTKAPAALGRLADLVDMMAAELERLGDDLADHKLSGSYDDEGEG